MKKLRNKLKTTTLKDIKKKPLITGLIAASLFTTEHRSFTTYNGENIGNGNY